MVKPVRKDNMFYKVYSNACRMFQSIFVIDVNEVQDAINDIIDYRWDCNDIPEPEGLPEEDFDEWYNNKIGELSAMLWKRLDENGRIDCGDYAVYKCEERPDRENKYGYEIL